MQKTSYFALIFFAAILLSISTTFGQSYVIPGKIVLNSGDTVSGFIHDKQSEGNPTHVSFQKEQNSAIQEFRVQDVLSFSTSRGAMFERHTIKYDDSKQALNTLSPSREPEHYATEVVLLRVLVNGGLKLLSYIDVTNRKHYFILENGEEPRELLNRDYLVTVSGQRGARTYEPWRQQLFMMAQQCPSLANTIKNNTKYNNSSLSSAFKALNKCLGFEVSETGASNEPTKRKTEFGFALHSFVTKITFETDRDGGKSRFKKPNLGFGGFVEFFSKKRPDRMSFYNEVKFKNINQEGTGTFIYTPVFKIQSIKLVNAVRFHYPVGKSSVFSSFGIANGYRSAKIRYVNKSGGAVYFAVPTEKKGIENGIIFGLGLKRKLGIADLSAIIDIDLEDLFVLSSSPHIRTSSVGLTLQGSF